VAKVSITHTIVLTKDLQRVEYEMKRKAGNLDRPCLNLASVRRVEMESKIL
jgi:hypothetical protein